MFSRLKRIEMNFCCSLGILRITEEGGSLKSFDPMSIIKKWSNDKVRWATEEKGPRSCKSRNIAEVNVKSLSDDDSYNEEENISENRDKERYLFSSDPE